jgi:uncharacterized membrane protein
VTAIAVDRSPWQQLGAGRWAFSVVLILVGLMGMVKGHFTGVWEPVPKYIPARELLAYVCAGISLCCGVGLLVSRTATWAARVLLITFLAWLLVMRLPPVILAPKTQDPWSGAGETAVFVAAAWVLFARFTADRRGSHQSLGTGATGLRGARVVYGLALLPFGTAHLAYINETASMVPAFLPAHLSVAYFTGAAFIGAGAGILLGVWARLAAILSTVQMGAFTLLVWLPIIVAGSRNAFQISETVLSVALTAAGWVVADSYRGTPWRPPR